MVVKSLVEDSLRIMVDEGVVIVFEELGIEVKIVDEEIEMIEIGGEVEGEKVVFSLDNVDVAMVISSSVEVIDSWVVFDTIDSDCGVVVSLNPK